MKKINIPAHDGKTKPGANIAIKSRIEALPPARYEQTFNITVSYDETATNDKEVHLSLGSTIIYKQK